MALNNLNVWYKIKTSVTIILLAEEDIVKGVRKGGKQLESKLFSKRLTPLMYIIVIFVNKGNL